jgi:hypothetical protein
MKTSQIHLCICFAGRVGSMENDRSELNPPISLQRGIIEMRSIPGMLQGDLIQISSKLTPDVANATISLLSIAVAYVLTLRISSNSNDFVSGHRPG